MSSLAPGCRAWLFLAVASLGPAWAAAPAAPPPLPYQSAAKHLGVATCATSVCHGSVTASSAQNVQLDEFVTWSHQDKHAQAYTALSGEKGRAIAAKLGIADARTDRTCLDCHADNVPAAQRAGTFNIADGVGCEACHGGADRWIASHSARGTRYSDDLARGMYPTARLSERTALCISCHYGNEDKFATHRMMGAGHPRLSFELDTFLALQPPHYRVDSDYERRKPVYSRAQTWSFAQLALAQRQLQLLQGPLVRQSAFVPELALLDCHACHENPLHQVDGPRSTLTHLTPPGSVPLPKGSFEMAIIAARQVDGAAAKEMVPLIQALQRATSGSTGQVTAAAAGLERVVERLRVQLLAHRWTTLDASQMLDEILRRGSAGEYVDYMSAEQCVMAVSVLLIDTGTADRLHDRVDELYRIVKDEDAYQPGRLREAMKALAAARSETPGQ